MTAVLKASTPGTLVRAVPTSGSTVQSPSPQAAALVAAEAEIARLTRELSQVEQRGKVAEQEAYAAGLAEGKRSEAAAADERFRVIEQGIRAADAMWRDRLAELDALAAELARAALAKVFAPSEDMAELTVRAIRRRIADLDAGSVVAISVSAADFPTEREAQALTEIAAALGKPVERSDELASGACRVELRVGEQAIGPADQWRGLSALLSSFADEEATA